MKLFLQYCEILIKFRKSLWKVSLRNILNAELFIIDILNLGYRTKLNLLID